MSECTDTVILNGQKMDCKTLVTLPNPFSSQGVILTLLTMCILYIQCRWHPLTDVCVGCIRIVKSVKFQSLKICTVAVIHLSNFIKDIFICIPKMNKGLTGLVHHGGE